ncbi:MAG: ABC transporter ATP-binding protein [Candidatus Lokiarchaeota archaeon]|nr:ABC transporter ATP-binding protein [Candidatus Harpocratesius repetitus]
MTTYSETSNNQPIIQICDGIKVYKRNEIETVALRGINCDFYTGQISVIMGPSGCGKTTLLNALAGITHLTSGIVVYKDRILQSMSSAELNHYRSHHLGYVFQSNNLLPHLTALENIYLGLEIADTLTSKQISRIKRLLIKFQLLDRAKHYPEELSGGEQQRISIIAAVANQPDILLCDEPTGELDSDSKKDVFNLLLSLLDEFPNTCIIVVTHDSDFIQIAHRVLYIKDGKISHIEENSNKTLQNQAFQITSDFLDTKKEKILHTIAELKELQYLLSQKIRKYEHDIE